MVQNKSKVPLRGFTQLLNNLDPGTKNSLMSAFADAENLIDYSNRTVPEIQNRRRISGTVATIVLSAESTIAGAFLRWDRLDDRRIAFYELQVSNDNIFSNPETYITFDTFFSIENISSVKFARVRGVTGGSGEAGLYSSTVQIRPSFSAPLARSINFYQNYNSDSKPTNKSKLIYSGGEEKRTVNFYTVMTDSFYIDKVTGGVSLWGYISSRLTQYRDGGRIPWDRVRFNVNGISQMDAYFPHWVNVYDENSFNTNDYDTNGDPMTFYGQGGYTAAFGPYGVSIPNTLEGYGPKDPNHAYNKDTTDGQFYWADPMNAIRASRFDHGQLPSLDITTPKHESAAYQITNGQVTDYIIFRDFRFELPTNAVVKGIKAQVKRRHISPPNNPIPVDQGNAVVNLPFVEFSTAVGFPSFDPSDIYEDATFGRYLHSPGGIGRLLRTESSPPQQLGITGNAFTISLWIVNETITTANREPFFGFNESGTAAISQLQARRLSGANSDQLNILYNFGTGSKSITISNFFDTSNQFINLVIVWDGTQVLVYKDAFLVAASTAPTNTIFDTSLLYIVELFAVTGLGSNNIQGGMAHVALWNTELSTDEIDDIYERGGRVDLRTNFGNYINSDNLAHYWLLLPDQAEITDHEVYLVDETDTVRSDLENKAVTDESWPRLSDFFYTSVKQYGFLPLANSDGIPHDNHTAIGYQEYGDEFDLWGASSWTAAQINDFYFGLAVRATNVSDQFPGNAYIDHAKLTVYTIPQEDRVVNVGVEVAAANEFYLEREIFGGVINLIELGDRLAPDPDC